MLHNAKCHYNLFFLKKKTTINPMKWNLNGWNGSYTNVILKELYFYILKKLGTKNLWYNQYSQKSMSLALEKQIWQTFLESLF